MLSLCWVINLYSQEKEKALAPRPLQLWLHFCPLPPSRTCPAALSIHQPFTLEPIVVHHHRRWGTFVS